MDTGTIQVIGLGQGAERCALCASNVRPVPVLNLHSVECTADRAKFNAETAPGDEHGLLVSGGAESISQ